MMNAAASGQNTEHVLFFAAGNHSLLVLAAQQQAILVHIIMNALKAVAGALHHHHHGDKDTVFITSADGVVAYRVARQLLAEEGNRKVRVGVPDPSSPAAAFLSELAEKGADVVAFDWNDVGTYGPALAGATSVFLAVPHHENWQQQIDAFFKAMKDAGVHNVVKLSFYHALHEPAGGGNCCDDGDVFSQIPFTQMHRTIDSHLMKAQGIANYVILFASHFMSNPLVYQSESLQKEGKFYGASNGKVMANSFAPVCAHERIGSLRYLSHNYSHSILYSTFLPFYYRNKREGRELREPERRC